MNGYQVTILSSNYIVMTAVIAEDEEDSFEQALYTLINSEPKIDLFDAELQFKAEFIEKIEEN